MTVACFECGAPATCRHHVVPRSRGGTATVPLCGACHGLAHGVGGAWTEHSKLTALAVARKRDRGEYTGGRVPYGWRLAADGASLEAHEGEQAAIRTARELRAAGLSYRKVGAALASRGVLPRNGGKWHATQVKRVLAARLLLEAYRDPELAREAVVRPLVQGSLFG